MPNDRLPTPDRVLVVAAHPDDIEFGAAGTVARWVGEGAEVRYLVMTRGDKGSDDPAADPAAIGRAREAEQRAAAAEIGVTGVDFLDEPDGQVEPSLRLRERVTFAIRSFRPEAVMTHDPTVVFVNNEWVNHPDHRAVGQVTVDAVYPTARDPLNFPQHIAGRPGCLEGRRAVPVEHQRGEPDRGHRRHDRAQDRGACPPPQPVPRLRRDGALAPPPRGRAR